jgi:hypothetical protein
VTAATFTRGDLVEHRSFAGRRLGFVVEVIRHGGTTPSGHPLPATVDYRVRFLDDHGDREVVSDLRQQAMWRLVAPAHMVDTTGYRRAWLELVAELDRFVPREARS